jgi:chaperonin cofactor prefoldin
MESNKHGGFRNNAGRKPLPDTVKKKTSVIRIDAELLPLVENLKRGLPVTKNQVWKQTSALSEDDLKEQANCIERLMTDKAQLSGQVQQLEKQLQLIKTDNDTVKAELVRVKESKPIPVSYGSVFAERKKMDDLQKKVDFLLDQKRMNDEALIRSNTHIVKCQCSTKAGRQCQNNATTEIKANGFYIAVCGQHFKELSKP